MDKRAYVIYGVNRVAKDFLYIFEEIDVLFFVDDEWEQETFLDKKVYTTEILREISYNIIICNYDKVKQRKKLEGMGYEYQKNFWYEEDFFYEIDELVFPRNRKLIAWGTGNKAVEFVCECQYDIDFFVDTYKYNTEFYGKKVVSPSEINDWKKYFIIIAASKDEGIRKQLAELKLIEDVDFVSYDKVMCLPSLMLRKTIFDQRQYNFECNTMLNHLEILTEGDTRCCCTTFLTYPLGRLRDNNVRQIWESNVHKILCLSAENKTYSFCNKNMCPFFIEKEVNSLKLESEQYKKMLSYPETLVLGYDPTCNLICSTCRNSSYIAKGEALQKNLDLSSMINDKLLEHCKFLIAAGSGEVFLSKAYQQVYLSEKATDIGCIRILTNGMLFTPKTWEEFRRDKKGKIMMTVSVDAATKETYSIIRCGGNFEQLQKNMLYASELRKEGELSYLRMNFVVQKNNYQEMVKFVEWGLELGVDEIFFTKILNWGTYSKEEFKEISMMEEDGVTPKKELKEVLEHPRMKESIVDLGTIQYSHEPVEDVVIENYYKWEVERKVQGLF